MAAKPHIIKELINVTARQRRLSDTTVGLVGDVANAIFERDVFDNGPRYWDMQGKPVYSVCGKERLIDALVFAFDYVERPTLWANLNTH